MKYNSYTLIELVITITLTSIIFAVVGIFVVKPIQIYVAINKRAELVAMANLALGKIEHDIHQALPNSIRIKTIGNKQALEMYHAVIAMRYRTQSPGNSSNILTFATAQTEFNVLGAFPPNLLTNPNNYRLVIYNTGAHAGTTDAPVAGANVYANSTATGPNPPSGTHVITPTTTTITLTNLGNEGHIVVNPAFQFALASPQQRIYLVDTPVSYIFEPTTASLTRFSNYIPSPIQAIEPTSAPLASASANLLAKHITNCTFQYQAGTSERGGIVTIAVTLAHEGEQIRLLQQVHIENAP